MLQNGLHFTLVSGDPKHKKAIGDAISSLSIKAQIEKFEACEPLMDHLEKNRYNVYQVIVLDLDNPAGVGMECVGAIRENIHLNDIVIIGYARNEKEEAVKDFFVEGGNIYFNYPKSTASFTKTFEKLVRLNWQIYSTGIKRQNLVMKI